MRGSALDVRELLCDLPVADAENVDAAYMTWAPGGIDPVVAPTHHGAVPGDDQFFGLEGPFVRVEELPEQRTDRDGTLVPFAVRGRRAINQTVIVKAATTASMS